MSICLKQQVLFNTLFFLLKKEIIGAPRQPDPIYRIKISTIHYPEFPFAGKPKHQT